MSDELTRESQREPWTDSFYSVHGDVRSDFGADASYIWLRDALIFAFNPPDGDGDEEGIITAALGAAVEFIEDQPCACTPAMIEDHDACRRCRVLGRRGNEPEQR